MNRTSKIIGWKYEAVLHDGDSYFREILGSIKRAKSTVDLEFFIFEKDVLGLHILQVLEQVAQSGVRVRLLVDGLGSANWNFLWIKSLENRGINVRVYHPLPWQAAGILDAFFGLLRINRRDHRKMVVVDSREGFVGGMNVSSCHLKSASGNLAWRDTGVCLKGAAVKYLYNAFERSWSQTARQFLWKWKKKERLPSFLRLNDHWRFRRDSRKKLLKFIYSSKKILWVATPYFNPDLFLLKALMNRAVQGVQVRLLLPNKSDVRHVSLISRVLYGVLLKAGVQIYEYVPSILHCKLLLCDSKAMVGSTNFNQRSIFFDLEVDVQLDKPSSIASIQKQFEEDFDKSLKIHYHTWFGRGYIAKIFERLALLLRNWS